MERLIFVDSNIWCYYFDRSAQEHDIISDKLEKVLEGGVAVTFAIMPPARVCLRAHVPPLARARLWGPADLPCCSSPPLLINPSQKTLCCPLPQDRNKIDQRSGYLNDKNLMQIVKLLK